MDITHNLKINASAKTIYDAVASENGIRSWWCKDCKVAENEDEISQLNFDKQGTKVKMLFRTETLTPNEKVVWESVESPNPAWAGTQIRTEISEGKDGCEVTFAHAGFDEKWKGHEAVEMTAETWNHFAQSLVSYCEKGEGQPW